MPSTSNSHVELAEGADESLASTGKGDAKDTSRITISNVVWPLLLSLAVLGGIGYFTFDVEAFRQIVRHLNGWLLVAAGGTVILRALFGGWRLHYFARGQLSFSGSIRSQLAWDFFAYVTPSTIGGGPFAAVFMARDRNLPLGEATSIILFSMLVDQICFALTIPALMLCAVYVDVFPRTLGAVGYWTLVLFFLGFMVWVSIFAYSTLLRPHLLEKLVERLFRLKWLRRFRERALSIVGDLQHRSRILRSQPVKFYVKGFGLTLMPWINRYLLSLFIIWSVYPRVDKWLVFLRSTALNLGSIALPTPGGSGGVEGLYVLFLGPPLIPESLVAPTLLVWRFMSYYLFIVVGIFITVRYLQKSIDLSEVLPSTPKTGASGD